MTDFRVNLDPQLKGTILGGVIGILSGLFSAYLTSNRNRRQQKYFKLQQIGEEIIDAIRKRQNADILYQIQKENINFQQEMLIQEIDLNKGKLQPNISKDSLEIYDRSSEKLKNFGEMKQIFYNTIFSKIQVYFSESGLSEVRDQSTILSKLIVEIYLEENENRKKEIVQEIQTICNKLKNTIIIKTIRYGRPFYKNIRHHRTNKYENQ